MSVYDDKKTVTTNATDKDDAVSRLGYEDTIEETAYDADLAKDRRDAVQMANASASLDEDESEEIAATRAQIEETRAHLSGTVDAIKEKLSPANMVEEAKDTVKAAATAKVDQVKDAVSSVAHSVMDTAHNAVDSAKDFVHNITDSAKDAVHSTGDAARPTLTKAQRQGETIVDAIRMNPLPAAIAGFGLGWLLLSIRKQHSLTANTYRTYDNDFNGANSFDRGTSSVGGTEFGYQSLDTEMSGAEGRVKSSLHNAGDAISGAAGAAKDKVSDVAGSAASLAGTAKDKVGDLAHSAQDKVSDLAYAAKDKASDIAYTVKDKASDLAYAAKDKSQEAVSALDSFVHNNPLAAGAVALLVGTAIGLALPSTLKENEWMGDTRDRLKDKATDAISDMTHKVQNVAEAAIDSAKDSMHNAVDAAKDTLKDAKDQVTEKVKTAAQSEGLTATPPPAPTTPVSQF